ncbi:MAG: hypothetical protein II874_00705 [Bacteroidales bacterium]|nr:hypothetical protein [Bacteroidales bacterium]
MEKKSTEILREIEAALASLKERVQALEAQVEAYRQATAGETEVDFDLEIGVDELPDGPAVPVEDIPAVSEDLPVEEEPVEMVVEDLPEPVVAPEPVPEPAPAPAPVLVPELQAPAATPKVDTERMAWRLDKPGVAVKNIRSGISLYDRALFIGTLFKEDYALYDKTIGNLNALSSLDEAVDYLVEAFPDWNLKSDIVYNFMMAIRKKLG